jgi:hypothetical protein
VEARSEHESFVLSSTVDDEDEEKGGAKTVKGNGLEEKWAARWAAWAAATREEKRGERREGAGPGEGVGPGRIRFYFYFSFKTVCKLSFEFKSNNV